MEQFYSLCGYSYYEPSYDSYNVGWEDYPSHGYEGDQEFTNIPYHQWMQPPPQTIPQGSSIEDMFYALVWDNMQFRQETRECLQKLENQIGELIASFNDLEEKLEELPEENDSAIVLANEEETIEEDAQANEFQYGVTSSEKVHDNPLSSDYTNVVVPTFPLQDIALAKSDTSSSKASVGEIDLIVQQGITPPKIGDTILEFHIDNRSPIYDCLMFKNPDFIGIERFLQVGAKLLDEWVDMNQFFDIQEDKIMLGKFEDSPSILMKLKAEFDCRKRTFHQPTTATTLALAILAIDGIEKFQI